MDFQQFGDFFHILYRFRFVRESVDFYQPVFVGIFANSTVAICGTMLMFHVELVESSFHFFLSRMDLMISALINF